MLTYTYLIIEVTMNMFSIAGKNVMVTGATRGIGHAIVEAFNAAGAQNIVGSGTKQDLLDDLKKTFGSKVHTLAFDLSDASHAGELFEKAEQIVDHIDILVCNAGITRDNLAIRMSDEEWDDVLKINLKAVFKLNQAAIKSMGKRKYGRIINISSIVGLTGNFGQANYAAAKAGIIGMSKSLALESATRGVTVNCIAPGFIKTDMTDKIREDIKEKILSKIPMGIMGEPKDIASAVIYLASDEARYITGHVLNINGGMYM